VAVEVDVEINDDVTTARTLRRGAKVGYGEMITELVGNRPTWLVTITHEKQTTHPEFSAKVRRQWLHGFNKEIFGSGYDRRGDGLLSFFGIEYQFSRAFKFGGRATVHQHGVVAGAPLVFFDRDRQKALLKDLARGWIKIDVPRHSVRAIRYCAKYAAKDGEIDIWLPGKVWAARGVARTGKVAGDTAMGLSGMDHSQIGE
jgi:hypothetical protein